jgi:nicotinate-nucleotide adenylyltransferase
MRIALFGGSFDPPHLGHVLAATYARSMAGVDAVWVMPVARHPFAKALSPFATRLTWCQAAFSPLGTWISVRDDEADNASGRTWDLLDLLDQRYPGHQWALIGGSDIVHQLPSWYRGAELAARIEFIAVPRRGFDDDPTALPEVSSSTIRARHAAGESVARWLPQALRGSWPG